MSDITFEGGNIGFHAGSQQFTARGLQFTSCLTAISSIWDWGFTWQDLTITSTYVAIDTTNYGGPILDTGHGQGTGSIAVVDSTFNGKSMCSPVRAPADDSDQLSRTVSPRSRAARLLILYSTTCKSQILTARRHPSFKRPVGLNSSLALQTARPPSSPGLWAFATHPCTIHQRTPVAT